MNLFEYDVAVLGGGVTGIVITDNLSRAGEKVALVDSYARLGGNQISRNIGDYTFDIGSFFFSADDGLFDAFPHAIQDCLPRAPKLQRIAPDGRIYSYPYDPKGELLSGQPVYEPLLAGASLAYAKLFRRAPANAAEFAVNHMGRRIYRRSGLGFYIERLFGLPAESIGIEFAARRLSWIASSGSVRAWLKRRRAALLKAPPGPRDPLVRPPGGFEVLYSRIERSLAARGVDLHLGREASAIRHLSGSKGFEVSLDDGRVIRARRLISTMPLEITARLLGLQVKRPLNHVSLLTLYYSCSGLQGFEGNVLYNFSNEGKWKRITVHSAFYGERQGRQYFNLEVPLSPTDSTDHERWAADFVSHAAAHRLFADDLRLEGWDLTRFAYPIYDPGAAEAASELVASLAAHGVETAGRQGNFDYIPTGRTAAVKARSFLQRARIHAAERTVSPRAPLLRDRRPPDQRSENIAPAAASAKVAPEDRRQLARSLRVDAARPLRP